MNDYYFSYFPIYLSIRNFPTEPQGRKNFNAVGDHDCLLLNEVSWNHRENFENNSANVTIWVRNPGYVAISYQIRVLSGIVLWMTGKTSSNCIRINTCFIGSFS